MKTHISTGRSTVPLRNISFLLILITVMTQVVIAEVQEVGEGASLNVESNTIRLKKADDEQGGFCRIKVGNSKDKTLKVGSTLDIGNYYLQAFTASESACSFIITPKAQLKEEKEYDIVDTLPLPLDGRVSEKKKYELNGKTFTVEVVKSFVPLGVMFIITPENHPVERTNVLSEGGVYTFSEQSLLTLFGLPNPSTVKFGMRVSPSPPSIAPQPPPSSLPVLEKQVSLEENVPQEEYTTEAVHPTKKKIMHTKKEKMDETQADIMLMKEEKLRQAISEEQRQCPPGFCYAGVDFHACLQPRTRVRLHDIPSYCDSDGIIKKQKEINELAQQSYECKSNIIDKGQCLPVKKDRSLFNRVFRVFARIWA